MKKRLKARLAGFAILGGGLALPAIASASVFSDAATDTVADMVTDAGVIGVALMGLIGLIALFFIAKKMLARGA